MEQLRLAEKLGGRIKIRHVVITDHRFRYCALGNIQKIFPEEKIPPPKCYHVACPNTITLHVVLPYFRLQGLSKANIQLKNLKEELRNFAEKYRSEHRTEFTDTYLHLLLGTDDITTKNGVPTNAVYNAFHVIQTEINSVITGQVQYFFHGFMNPIANFHRGPNSHTFKEWGLRKLVIPSIIYEDLTADMDYHDLWLGTKIPTPEYMMQVARRITSFIAAQGCKPHNLLRTHDRFPVEMFQAPIVSISVQCQVPQDFEGTVAIPRQVESDSSTGPVNDQLKEIVSNLFAGSDMVNEVLNQLQSETFMETNQAEFEEIDTSSSKEESNDVFQLGNDALYSSDRPDIDNEPDSATMDVEPQPFKNFPAKSTDHDYHQKYQLIAVPTNSHPLECNPSSSSISELPDFSESE